MAIKYPAWGAEQYLGSRYAVLLYGFDIGKAKLKHEHTQVLDQYSSMVREGAKSRNFAIVAKGNASTTGSAAFNLGLSAERATAIANYLKPLLPAGSFVIPLAQGEAAALLDGLPQDIESERHRSVLLMAVDFKKTDPPPPPRRILLQIPKRHVVQPGGYYSVQLLAGYEGSAGIPLPFGFSVGGQVSRLKLRIRDIARGQYGDFMLTMGSYKADWGSPGSLEKLGPGPEKQFTGPKNLHIWDLAGFVDYQFGSADFGTQLAGIGSVSCTRTLEPSDEFAYVRFTLPPGDQQWEFGKFGAGLGSGKGYLSVAD